MTVSGGGVTVNNVVVGSSTSLTANFVLDLAAASGPRTVTVTTAGGTSGAQTFTITLPPPGSSTFAYTGGPQTFTVPAGVVSITILADGRVGRWLGTSAAARAGLGGRTTATVSVTPGASLTVLCRWSGPGRIFDAGGFNGGGSGTGSGGGGGGASSVRDGATPLVVVGGGGGGGVGSAGGAPAGTAAPAVASRLVQARSAAQGGGGGGGGTQAAGGAGGARGSPTGTDGTAGAAGTGWNRWQRPIRSHWWRRRWRGLLRRRRRRRWKSRHAGGGGGGGGSSFTAPGATAVLHEQGPAQVGDLSGIA